MVPLLCDRIRTIEGDLAVYGVRFGLKYGVAELVVLCGRPAHPASGA